MHALDQRRKRDNWFMRAAADLESELKGVVPFHLRISLSYRAVDKGQDWKAVKASIKAWILNDAPNLPNGARQVSLAGVPFDIEIEKADEPPGIFFGRKIEPTDETLVTTISEQIPDKARKLAPYKSRGMTTLLLIESNDMAMMNHIKVAEAMEANFPSGLPDGVDQVWYADTTLRVESARF